MFENDKSERTLKDTTFEKVGGRQRYVYRLQILTWFPIIFSDNTLVGWMSYLRGIKPDCIVVRIVTYQDVFCLCGVGVDVACVGRIRPMSCQFERPVLSPL